MFVKAIHGMIEPHRMHIVFIMYSYHDIGPVSRMRSESARCASQCPGASWHDDVNGNREPHTFLTIRTGSDVRVGAAVPRLAPDSRSAALGFVQPGNPTQIGSVSNGVRIKMDTASLSTGSPLFPHGRGCSKTRRLLLTFDGSAFAARISNWACPLAETAWDIRALPIPTLFSCQWSLMWHGLKPVRETA